MSVKVIAFFNNKGGVGKTSLVYHMAWMFAERGKRVLAVDIDPQANLTAAFLDEDRLEMLWPEDQDAKSIFGAIHPLKRGVGDIDVPHLELVHEGVSSDSFSSDQLSFFNNSSMDDRLAIIPGDMALSSFEDDLSSVWSKCLGKDERAFRVVSAFWRVMQKGASQHQADIILVDLGPNLGAINRAALISSDYIVIPLGPDLFSLQGLKNLGPTVRTWREEWEQRLPKNPDNNLVLPNGGMKPIGYIVTQHSERQDRPVKAYEKWIARIPGYYREYVLNKRAKSPPPVKEDEHCFALLRHYRSLMPMAQEARKPIFLLKPADGALGAHTYAVQEAYKDFLSLAKKIGSCVGIELQ
jgi:chromosome partitioning protein